MMLKYKAVEPDEVKPAFEVRDELCGINAVSRRILNT